MGGSGKKLSGGGARHKSHTPRPTAALGHSPIPHPLRLVAGQRFTPLHARRRRPFTLTRVDRDGRVRAVKDDRGREQIELRAARLLAADERGCGIHYRFVGYRAGRRYRTYAYVAGLSGVTATLVLPDWHPLRIVPYPARLLPGARAGAWLELTADLGQARAGALNPANLRIRTDPGEKVCHRPDPSALRERPEPPPRPPPRLGRGCGDIVIETGTPLTQLGCEAIELHLTLPVRAVRGGRAYLVNADEREVTSYLEILASDHTPNGTRLRCGATLQRLEVAIAVEGPVQTGYWRWRWWPRALERPNALPQLAAFRYDPTEHSDDIPWRAPR